MGTPCWPCNTHWQVVRAIPVPNEQVLGGFIPNPAFPSDHLAVCMCGLLPGGMHSLMTHLPNHAEIPLCHCRR
jgi:hypothetical protein